jgi:hypothetical protein
MLRREQGWVGARHAIASRDQSEDGSGRTHPEEEQQRRALPGRRSRMNSSPSNPRPAPARSPPPARRCSSAGTRDKQTCRAPPPRA